MTTSAIQALAMGLPCITTDHSGFREQIIDGKNGYVVPEGDWDALALRILYYMDHSEVWKAFGEHGRAYMKEHYDNDVLITQQIRVYDEVIST
jgi:colanic acid/amylovoran biosynthesis glycosyltransferase